MGKKKDPRAGTMRKRAHAGGGSGKDWWRKLRLPRRGKKQTRLVPGPLTTDQETILKKRQSKLAKALAAPRTIKLKNLSVSDWDSETGRACVETPRGNMLHSMGYYQDGKQYLYPEEALFLVDKGVMDLRYGGRPCSMQLSWALCFDANDSLNSREYFTYAHLRRAGYVVRRAMIGSDYNTEGSTEDGKKDSCDTSLAVGEFKISLSCWRVGAWKRRAEPRALFHVAVYGLDDAPPTVVDVAALATRVEKTRVKIALIDRGMVILTDVSCNATPLSERFRKKLNPSKDTEGEDDEKDEITPADMDN